MLAEGIDCNAVWIIDEDRLMKEKNYYIGDMLVIMPPLTPEEKRRLFTMLDSKPMTITRPDRRPQQTPDTGKQEPPTE